MWIEASLKSFDRTQAERSWRALFAKEIFPRVPFWEPNRTLGYFDE
jgi:hypothetical protein